MENQVVYHAQQNACELQLRQVFKEFDVLCCGFANDFVYVAGLALICACQTNQLVKCNKSLHIIRVTTKSWQRRVHSLWVGT